jgi:hypothetical protein
MTGMAKVATPPSVLGTAALPRNFTLTTEDRLRALASGPPAFSLRLRRIELLEEAVVKAIADHAAETGALPDAATLPFPVRRDVERLNRLIDDHNRYYPIEARLPMDVRTRRLMDGGTPWAPMPHVTAEALVAAARARPR